MLHVIIEGLNQELSFEDGSVTNFVTLVLPNNVKVRAIVSDASVVEIIAQATGKAPPPRPAPPAVVQERVDPPPTFQAPEPSPPAYDEGEGAVVFGGDAVSDLDEEPATFWPSPTASERTPTAPVAVAHIPNPALSSRDPLTQQRAYQQQQKDQAGRAKQGPSIGRTVPRDEFGYPVGRASGTDPASVVGGGAPDEDGVGQA